MKVDGARSLAEALLDSLSRRRAGPNDPGAAAAAPNEPGAPPPPLLPFVSPRELATIPRAAIETLSRHLCQSTYLGDRTLLCRVLGKYLVYADATDTGITPHLSMNGCWETWTTLAIAGLVQPGWACLDVGANHGYYTLLMADAVGPTGRVLAIEPTPRLARLLKETVNVNGFTERTEVLDKAATDRDGEVVDLVMPRGRGMNASICANPSEDHDVVAVGTTTLDSLTRDWPRLDLVKIDVEGAEEQVWRGMQGMLARHPAVAIILEFNARRYADPRAFLQEFEGAGFPLRFIDYDGSIRPVALDDACSAERSDDWMLFLQRV